AGVPFAWVHADKASEADIAKALDGAKVVIVDAPRTDDKAQVERGAGRLLQENKLPAVNISVMNRPQRLLPVNIDGAVGQRVFDYYVAGTRANHDRLFAYLKTWMAGGDVSKVEPPIELVNGGIYHGGYETTLFESLPAYLAWWEKRAKASWQGRPVIGMEISSSYISDGQTRLLDDTVAAIEHAGGVPLVFYRSSRSARAQSSSRDAANADAAQGRSGRPRSADTAISAEAPQTPSAEGRPAEVRGGGEGRRGGRPKAVEATPVQDVAQTAATEPRPAEGRGTGGSGRPRRTGAGADGPGGPGFPNPKEARVVEVNEPLVTLDGRVILNVLVVNTFIGGDPEGRKAWHQAMGIPVVHALSYRQGDRAAYAKDTAGINSFSLPFTLTQSEYIGMQDPVMLSSNEGGEMVSMPEQMDLLIGKAMNLAMLQTKANADKRVALLFWNHPPGEKNQSASNLNVPRSIELLVANLRKEGYAFDAATEAQIIATVGEMLRPVYRKGGVTELMKTAHWAFVPLADYTAWYAALPVSVREDVEKFWGGAEKSPWLAEKDGVKGFVVPRMRLGNLVVMPQPSRGEMATDEQEKKLFHDVKIPLSHSYMAAYLWIRAQYAADAIIHFGTHGSQEWTPGKERGMWAYDYPQILVGNTPVIYPYIVDNISEAIHVKRRGRGVIVSHQTPAFAPAGLSDDFVKINDLIREYTALDEGLVKQSNRRLIIEQARKMNIHKDLKWDAEKLESDFDGLVRDLEDYLEDMGAAMQPLGLHTLGQNAEQQHMISNVMQMLGQPLYEATGVKNAKAAFRGDYKELKNTAPFRFVQDHVFAEGDDARKAVDALDGPKKGLVAKGGKYRIDLKADWETAAVVSGLGARWIDPSYGGDPIRNPDALHTGRNVYGFDPSRIPTKAAYEAGKGEMERLIEEHRKTKGKAPQKLTFSVWSTETMRHLGMLEGQIMAAMGVRPTWDEGGRVTGMEVIPMKELGRPRIDPVISITGLYRDQFPNVMERMNEALVMVAALDEPADLNPIRANSRRIETQLMAQGVAAAAARNFSLTRIYGNESGNYGTGLPDATLASDKWEEKDGKLALGYLSRMSWGFGPDVGTWSEKARGEGGKEVNVYAEHLKGTDAAVFSRSSNLRGLLDTDHPFEYLGGISLAVRHLDGTSPQLYISNMRDPLRAKLETAEKFMAKELRAVYQHPRWMAEMQKEGYAGTLKMLDSINNFWGWQAMDRNVVRDDQWQEFHESWVKDRYSLGMRDWFEKANPTALAQITERMLEAIRKDYWKADEVTKRELVEIYQDLATRHDVHTNNQVFKDYVTELAQGFGIGQPKLTPSAYAPPPKPEPRAAEPPPQEPQASPKMETVRGQELSEVKPPPPAEDQFWLFALLTAALIGSGMLWQSLQAWRDDKLFAVRPEHA
ncbi:MAG: cobaltochelatase subunit CobN, partial [Hyphomicrobium sp.]